MGSPPGVDAALCPVDKARVSRFVVILWLAVLFTTCTVPIFVAYLLACDVVALVMSICPVLRVAVGLALWTVPILVADIGPGGPIASVMPQAVVMWFAVNSTVGSVPVV